MLTGFSTAFPPKWNQAFRCLLHTREYCSSFQVKLKGILSPKNPNIWYGMQCKTKMSINRMCHLVAKFCSKKLCANEFLALTNFRYPWVCDLSHDEDDDCNRKHQRLSKKACGIGFWVWSLLHTDFYNLTKIWLKMFIFWQEKTWNEDTDGHQQERTWYYVYFGLGLL